MEFSELFNKRERLLELAGDRILVTILINVGLVVAKSKQGVGHRSEDVEKNMQL